MGIRVHKVIGYGLTDVQTGRTKGSGCRILVDKRFRTDGLMYADIDLDDQWSLEGYEKFLEGWGKDNDSTRKALLDKFMFTDLARRRRDDRRYQRISAWDPFRSVIYDVEFGLPNVMVIVPFAHFLWWSRYDDTVDYCEETERYGQNCRVVEFSRGIYPYSDMFWDPKKRETIFRPIPEVAERRVKDGSLFHLVPSEIEALAEYLKIFKDPEDVRTLKPLLYVYWA